MAELAKYSIDHDKGCGFIAGIFHRRSYKIRRVPSLTQNDNDRVRNAPISDNKKKHSHRTPPTPSRNSTVRRTISADCALLNSPKNGAVKSSPGKITKRPSSVPPRHSPDVARSSTSSSSTSSGTKIKEDHTTCNSRDIVIHSNNHRVGHVSKALARSGSGNIIPLGRMGNIVRQSSGGDLAKFKAVNSNATDALKSTGNILRQSGGGELAKWNGVSSNVEAFKSTGNIMWQSSGGLLAKWKGVNSKADAERLKVMGNEAYKMGRYEEALGLYDEAIAVDQNKAIYRSNKSAALIGLGRLLEALVECKEAIRIDPNYHRAHHRLATLYLRLGEAEKAVDHYKQSGPFHDSKDITKAEALQVQLGKCMEARKLKQWTDLLKGAQNSITSLGADSAPQVYAMQAEALLRLLRHQEACATYHKAPNFAVQLYTKLFGPASSAYFLMIWAQVYMAAGRFEDAVKSAQQAARLDPNNTEAITVVKRAKATESVRISGNLLFKASKYSEACIVYGEGIEYDPYNSVLLCNRAACRSKLGQYEKAIEDCTATLNVQPSYSKARLRRADCNAKLERWEASIQDYEMLIREIPGDEEVGRALFEARLELKKQRGEDVKDMKFGSNLVFISTNERFRHFVTSPGMAVVLFCNKAKHNQLLQLMEKVCKRYPSVNFLKVEVEDHPYLAKLEGVSSVPAFKIYKNGSKMKEIPGYSRDLLEKSVKMYSMQLN